MAKILFYGAFQAIVGQAEIELVISGSSTFSKVLDELFDTFPDLKQSLFIPDKESIRPEVLLLHNGKLVREPAGGVLVKPDDEIIIMHQISGG
jgi:molybdopterin converting factor small subunit